MAKKKLRQIVGYEKQPPNLLFHHAPMDEDKFMALDATVEPTPFPGMAFHRDPGLFEHIREKGVAPDRYFREGLAAPPIEGNESGLRHYVAKLDADPNRILNLDVPLDAQTQDVRQALAKMGIRSGESYTGEPMSMASVLWESALNDSPEMLQGIEYGRGATPIDRESVARRLAGDAPRAEDLFVPPGETRVIGSMVAPRVLNILDEAGIPAASGQSGGWPIAWQAGAVYAPDRAHDSNIGPGAGGIRVFRPDRLEILAKFGIPGAIAAGAASQQSDPTDLRSSLLSQ